MKITKRAAALVSGLAVAAVALTGCSTGAGTTTGSPASPVSQSAIDKAMNTPTTLTFWTWVPNVSDEVALFEKKYPKITVKVENVGQGLAHYQKLRTALKSGSGAPDVAQMEYQYLSSFEVTKNLADLTPYGAADTKSDYPAWIWNQITQGSAIYAVPQDSGPMGDLYRSDLFQKAGITQAPTTYAEYASDAAKLKAATGAYIGNLASNDPAQMVGLLWQAGAHPFGYDGKKTVSIDVDSPAAKKVYAYWQDLVQKGYVATDPDFTDSWYTGFNKGKYATWITAAWGPMFLSGSAESTSGKWRAAPMPQWDASAPVSGNWGGSTTAVIKSTKNAIAAAQFAQFLNSDPDCASLFASKQFLFPSTKALLADSSFTGQTPAFYGGQQVNEVFVPAANGIGTFDWSPFQDYSYNTQTTVVGNAIQGQTPWSSVADDIQQQVSSYASKQGFKVSK